VYENLVLWHRVFFLKVSNKAVEELEFMKAVQKRSSWTQESLEENMDGVILGLKF